MIHISLKISKQAIPDLLDSNEARYRKAQSRKAKGALLTQLMELTAYKSSENIIRYYTKKKRPTLLERRGRRSKRAPQDIPIIKQLWLKSGQPCGKRLHAMLPIGLHSLSKRHDTGENRKSAKTTVFASGFAGHMTRVSPPYGARPPTQQIKSSAPDVHRERSKGALRASYLRRRRATSPANARSDKVAAEGSGTTPTAFSTIPPG